MVIGVPLSDLATAAAVCRPYQKLEARKRNILIFLLYFIEIIIFLPIPCNFLHDFM